MDNFELPKPELLDGSQSLYLERILEISRMTRPGKDYESNCMGAALYIVGAVDNYSSHSSKKTLPYLEKMKKDPSPLRFGDLIAWMNETRDQCFHLGIIVETEPADDPYVFSWGCHRRPEISLLSQIKSDSTISVFYYRPNFTSEIP